MFDAYQGGLIIGKPLFEAASVDDEGELPIHQRAIEEAVLDLIDERERSRALEKVAASVLSGPCRRRRGARASCG